MTSRLEAESVQTAHAGAWAYVQLMKPRIMLLVVFTALVGLVIAQSITGLTIDIILASIALLAVALGSGAAGAINMWYDSDIDRLMHRTSARPVPAGLIPREEALSFGIILSGVSVLLMWMSSNFVAAVLLALSIFYYGVVYTIWLKRRTPHNIVIGGGAGALPPVIGWAIITGSVSLEAWILFAVIFFWTPPHFWALSLLAKNEYMLAKVPMLPVAHGVSNTRMQILVYSVILVMISSLPVFAGFGGVLYALTSLATGLVFLWMTVDLKFSQAGSETASSRDRLKAMRLFGFSILYLFLLFAVLLIEHGFGVFYPFQGISP